MYDSFTHIMAGGKRVSAVKHITVIERGGGGASDISKHIMAERRWCA